MFALHAAADLYGQKVNLELLWDARPSLAELRTQLQRLFDVEGGRRGEGFPPEPFVLDRLLIYDELEDGWRELQREAQLHTMAQVFAFQPEGSPHTAQVAPIPAPARRLQLTSHAVPDGVLSQTRLVDRWVSTAARWHSSGAARLVSGCS
eukprot:Hpha_TRINITY_DN36090_c0_g1::TRINITY_DN36090_c0_g1_i1::g.170825::m.170825